MGIYRSFISSPESASSASLIEPSDRLITPANSLTLARPILAAKAAKMLIQGQKGVLVPAFLMGLSDAEGNVARAIDKFFPNSGLGTSTKGAEYDPIADVLALLILSGGVLAGPRVHPLGKAAVLTVLGQEGLKTLWSLDANAAYKKLTGSETNLSMPPNPGGKEAMAEKISAVGLAACTNDLEKPLAKTALGAAALGFATVGSLRGFYHYEDYMNGFADMMSDFPEERQYSASPFNSIARRYEAATHSFRGILSDLDNLPEW